MIWEHGQLQRIPIAHTTADVTQRQYVAIPSFSSDATAGITMYDDGKTRCELCGKVLKFSNNPNTINFSGAWFVMKEKTVEGYEHHGWHCRECKQLITTYNDFFGTAEYREDRLADLIVKRVLQGSPNPETDYLKRRRRTP